MGNWILPLHRLMLPVSEVCQSSIQLSSVTQSCPTLCDPMDCSMPGLPVYHQLPELAQTDVRWVSAHLTLCRPLLLPPSIFHNIRVFSNESVLCIRWSKYWSFSLSISPSSEYSDWFPLGWTGWIALQSKGLSRVFSYTTFQKHQIKSSTFFIVQLSHPYMTSGKTIALTRWTFVSKVMSLLFNMLSSWS